MLPLNFKFPIKGENLIDSFNILDISLSETLTSFKLKFKFRPFNPILSNSVRSIAPLPSI